MARIVHLHHVNKDAFLKGNEDPDLDEHDLVFDASPNYVELLEDVRKELNWMDPSDIVMLEGRHTHTLENNGYQLGTTLACIQGSGVRISRQGS